MDAKPVLERILKACKESRLEVVLIGNAGAAIQGSPVTTEDFDFVFRDTPRNLEKLEELSIRLGAPLTKPYRPLSQLYRLKSKEMQVDLMPGAPGLARFESLKSRADKVSIGSEKLLVADLADIIKAKRAANRPKDRAVLPVLEETLREKKKLEETKEK